MITKHNVVPTEYHLLRKGVAHSAAGVTRRHQDRLCVLLAAVLTTTFAPVAFGGTADTFTNAGSTSALDLDANWSAGVPKSVNDAIIDGTFPLVGAGATTLTLSSNQTFGSLNDVNTNALTVQNPIANTAGATSIYTLTLGGATTSDSYSGSAAGDLLYVGANSSITFNSSTSTTATYGTLNIALGESGNFDIAGMATIYSTISGSGKVLTKTGAGTLILSGHTTLATDNTFSGGAVINAGVLQIENTYELGPSLGATINGGALRVDGTFYSGRTFTLGGANSTIDVGSGYQFEISSAVTDAVAGTAGALNVNGSTSGDVGNLTLYGTNTYTGATIINGGTLQLGLIVSGVGTGGKLSLSSNITDNGMLAIDRSNAVVQGVDFSAAAITGSGGVSQIGSSTLTLNAANTYSGATSVSAGTLDLSNSAAIQNSVLAIGASGAVLFDSSVTSNAFTTGGLSGSGALALANTAGTPAAVALAIGNNTTGTILYSGVLSGAGSLVHTGTGTQELSGANTYTGGTTISSGTVDVDSASASPTALGTGTVSIGAGTLQYYDPGYTYISGSTIANAISLTSSSSTIEVGTASGDSRYGVILSGTISNSGTLNKSGTGVLDVSPSGTNSYTGGTYITAGTVDFTTIRGLPTTNTTAGPISISSGATFEYDGSGGTTNTRNTINLLGAGVATIDVTGILYNYGVISGGALLKKTGSSTLELISENLGLTTLTANTYTGGTDISAGTLALYGEPYELPSSGTVQIEAGATFSYLSEGLASTPTLPSVPFNLSSTPAGSSTISVTNPGGAAVTLTLPGVISGANPLVKAGNNGLALTGANTYTGGTTISAGTLVANTSTSSATMSATGSGAVTIAAAGTLAGGTPSVPGMVTGAVTVNGTVTAGSGATVSDTVGKLSTGNQTWSSTGSFIVKVDGVNSTPAAYGSGATTTANTNASSNDQLILSGLTSVSSSFKIVPVAITSGASSFAPSSSYSWIIATASSGTFAGLPGDNGITTSFALGTSSVVPDTSMPAGTYDLETDSAGDELILDYTDTAPEPTSAILLGLASLPMLVERRRRVGKH